MTLSVASPLMVQPAGIGGIGGIVIAVAAHLVELADRASQKIRHERLLIFFTL
jgi:hypothetical protein